MERGKGTANQAATGNRTSTRKATPAESRPRQDYPWPWSGYSTHPDEMPLPGYALLLATYGALFVPLWSVLWRRTSGGRAASPGDIVLFGIATHKAGRILTKDWVTSPLRAPFTEYVESQGGGEVAERSRGRGLRRAVGDLLTCPWCIAPWVAGALYAGFLVHPRAARLVAAGAASVALSDVLQHVFAASKRLSR